MVWHLDAEQSQRLHALKRSRDLHRLGAALAKAMPAVQTRLATRYDEFIELGARRGSGHGLSHLACLGRYIACWAALGGDFEARNPWAGALLGDATCSEGSKAFQLCVRVAEQLNRASQPGQLTAAEFSAALQDLDGHLLDAGVLGSLMPPEHIRLGSPCDLDALELGAFDGDGPQYYKAKDGQWSRIRAQTTRVPVKVVAGDATGAAGSDAGSAGGQPTSAFPPLLSFLCSTRVGEATRLRLRTRMDNCCDVQVHPLVSLQSPAGTSEWRGPQARELAVPLQADSPAPAQGNGPSPTIAREGAPRYSLLSLSTCGLRSTGQSVGNLRTQIAAYADEQHLMVWHREPGPPTIWPEAAGSSAMPPSRVRIERDGTALDPSRWQAGFDDLDRRLWAALSSLALAWERESGVTQARLSAEPRVMCGNAGITWGWAEGPSGMSSPPFHRVAGQMNLVACQLDLRFSGTLAVQGSLSKLTLGCVAVEALKATWERTAGEADLLQSLGQAQTTFSQPFTLSLESVARPDAAMLSVAGPVQGALVGSCGLRPLADGSGLEWFVTLEVEPASVLLQWHHPVLGQQELRQPLLPAMKLLDWSLG